MGARKLVFWRRDGVDEQERPKEQDKNLENDTGVAGIFSELRARGLTALTGATHLSPEIEPTLA